MGKYSTNKAGAKYGTGYCDGQCPRDLKFINGQVCHLFIALRSPVATLRFGQVGFERLQYVGIADSLSSHPYFCSAFICLLVTISLSSKNEPKNLNLAF